MKPLPEYRKALAYMHIATFFFGTTAILGKLITVNQFALVWHRMGWAALMFLCLPIFWKGIMVIPKQRLLVFFLIGFIVALHWLTFYGSIKMSNSASLALVCFGTVSSFAAILEPLILKRKFYKHELFLGLLVLLGLILVTYANPENEISLKSSYIQAILVGVLSAFLAAVFSILNKKYIENYSPVATTWAQMLGGFVLLCVFIPFFTNTQFELVLVLSKQDMLFMFLLVLFCTVFAFSLEMQALKTVSAFTSNLILNLEPVYGFILAAVLFKEHETLNLQFYMGASLILLAVFLQPYIKRKKANGLKANGRKQL